MSDEEKKLDELYQMVQETLYDISERREYYNGIEGLERVYQAAKEDPLILKYASAGTAEVYMWSNLDEQKVPLDVRLTTILRLATWFQEYKAEYLSKQGLEP